MKIVITGVKHEELEVTNFTIEPNQMTIECAKLTELVEKGIEFQPVVIDTPPPPPVVVYELVPTKKLGDSSVEDFKQAGWSEQQLIDNGYLERVEQAVIEQVPAASQPPAPPAADEPATKATNDNLTVHVNGQEYVMAPKAAGTTMQQFIDRGWTEDDLIKQEFLVPKNKTEKAEFPYQNENGEWVDSAGVIWNGEKHSMSKSGVPPVTTKGLFKKKRGYVEPKDAPADNTDPNQTQAAQDVAPPPPAPAAPPAPAMEAPAAPSVPAAPAAPTVGDDDLDAELENILSDW